MKGSLFEQRAIINKEVMPELVPEQAQEEEKEVLHKFGRLGRNKTKRVITSLMLVSALVFNAGTFEAYATEKKQGVRVEQIEKKKNREQIAMNLLEQLFALPDNPQAQIGNLTQQYALKKDAARMLVLSYAFQRKLGFPEGKIKISGRLSTRDIKEALDELNVAFGPFIDKKYGNKDGKIDPKELDKALKTIKGSPEIINGNPGLQTFIEMRQQYSIFMDWEKDLKK